MGRTMFGVSCCSLIVGVLYLQIIHYQHSPSEISKYPKKELKEVAIAKGDKSFTLDKAHWAPLLTKIGTMVSTDNIGMQGEHWTTLLEVELKWEKRGIVAIEFMTRPSVAPNIVGLFKMKAGDSYLIYGQFEAIQLYRWLESFIPTDI